jgi:alkanesulfonate monooxygenase SsuD/methylene tetrahydromethanopterin reductase-like flavin-dependent oxidoreductase (luciferase family)
MMKLGMFMQPLHHPGWDYHEMFAMDAEACIHADRVGYDEVWIGEHYSQKTEPIPNVLMFLSYLLPLTSRIALCTGTINLPNRHPAQVAGDIAMFDHLSKGRFRVGIGPGGLASDAELFKSNRPDRSQMLTNSWDIIQTLWNTEPPYEIDSPYWDITLKDTVNTELGIGLLLKPYQQPFPKPATSAMSPASGTAKLAGERGWELISANFNPINIVKTHWESYQKGAEAAGRTADIADWRITRSLFVADTNEQAEEYLARPENTLRRYFTYMIHHLTKLGFIQIFKTRPDMRDDEVTVDHCLKEMVIAGDAETVAARILKLTDELGPFGTLLTTYHEWDDADLWRRSMQLTAQQVMPIVNAEMMVPA